MNYFNDIKDVQLQAYNRLMIARNLQEMAGRPKAEAYLKGISKADQKRMAEVLVAIEKLGEPAFKRGLTKKMVIV